MLFNWAAFTSFMSGSTVATAINTGTVIGAVFSVVGFLDKLQKSRREDSDYENLLWNAFFESANATFSKMVAECSVLDWANLRVHQDKLEEVEITHGDKPPFIQIAYDKDKLLTYYSKYFSEMRAVLIQKRIVYREYVDGLFDGIEWKAFQDWRCNFSLLCEGDSLLKEWLNQNRLLDTVSVANGADNHLLQRKITGEYWAQTITFGEGTVPFPARPDNLGPEARERWWAELKQQLDIGPLFLIGPGGMGKSAFLAYLYQTIAEQSPECPFGGAFLLSLDTLLSNAGVKMDPDATPFSNPNKSLLLSRIASKVEGSSCKDWRTVLKWGTVETLNKPVLLLLDGLNEMRSRKRNRGDVYQHIVNEIAALANREEFQNTRLIVTTRIETTGSKTNVECQEQLNDLPMGKYAGGANFRTCILSGISQDLPESDSLSEEMRELLRRPMYYKHFQNRPVPATRYSALKDMYGMLSEQSVENIATNASNRKQQRKCVFEVLLPVIAYHIWVGEEDALNNSYSELVKGCTLRLIAKRFNYSSTNDALKFARTVCTEVGELLEQQEQLLIIEDSQYIFSHQDYRDYLVAEYFLQRLDYLRPAQRKFMLGNADIKIWVDSLRLNTYSRDILKLIYQALSFEANYVGYFSIDRELNYRDLTPACILWYTTAYQLSDLKRLTGIAYQGDLQEDTLAVLKPLVYYALKEAAHAGTPRCHKVLQELSSKLKFHLTEVLMKACELYRNKGEFVTALKITKAAKYVYNNRPRMMSSVINHNEAMIQLYDFMKSEHTKDLSSALKTLQKCAEGTTIIFPYRFSCTIYALLLVSPHPRLKKESAYETFVAALSEEKPLPVRAFWAYYDAIFDKRKQGEDWQPRLYSLRQFLFLLAENKVEAVLSPDFKLDAIEDLANEEATENLSIRVPVSKSPLPTIDSLRLIGAFLKEIDGFDEGWMHYFNGLISYHIDADREKARSEFNLACESSKHKDIRAALWLAYLDGNQEQLHQIYRSEREKANRAGENANMKINSYHVGEYYERDIGRLYNALCTL